VWRAQLGDAELDALLDRGLALFRFLEDRDVFERYYKQHMARRLLGGRAASDDAERAMITRLKARDPRTQTGTSTSIAWGTYLCSEGGRAHRPSVGTRLRRGWRACSPTSKCPRTSWPRTASKHVHGYAVHLHPP
jgi:hypothetical protein